MPFERLACSLSLCGHSTYNFLSSPARLLNPPGDEATVYVNRDGVKTQFLTSSTRVVDAHRLAAYAQYSENQSVYVDIYLSWSSFVHYSNYQHHLEIAKYLIKIATLG